MRFGTRTCTSVWISSIAAVVLIAALLAVDPLAPRARAQSNAEEGSSNSSAKGATALDLEAIGGPPKGRFRGNTRVSDEIVGRRTRTSRTRATDYGALQTEIFPLSIHYRANGKWEQIRNELTSSSADNYAYENAANRYRLLLPRSIEGSPVRINYEGHVATMALQGARGRASVTANEATYPGALPGVDVVYSARNDSIKEKLLLQDVNATSAFEWRLTTSGNLDVKETSVGGLSFSSASTGKLLFTIPPPFIYDAGREDSGIAPPHAFELVETEGKKSIRLTIDGSWLNDPARQFPVTVDPDVLFTLRDCWIRSNYPNANICSDDQLRVGWNGNDTKRALVKFDLANFPDNAEVLNAEFALNLLDQRGTQLPENVVFRPITEKWGNDVTWNYPWSTPGGVWDSTKGYRNEEMEDTAGWYFWHPTDLVKDWIAGTTTNRGAMIKARTEAADKTLWFASSSHSDSSLWPRLTVTWDHGGMGEFSTYKLEDHQLTDRAHLHANVAGGNLMVHHTDVVIRGQAGMDLRIDRYFNGLLHTNFLETDSNVGEGWTLSVGGDIGLKIYGDDSAAYFGDSGYRVPFTKSRTSGPLKSPPGLDADLEQMTDGRWELTWRKSKERFVFDAGGHILREVDKNGNAIRFNYTDNKVTSIEDTLGRVTQLAYDANGMLDTITDPIGRVHDYDYEANKLIRYTNPEGESYEYGYDASENLKTFRDPLAATTDGHETHFTYQADDFVSQIKYVADATTSPATGDTTTFEYTSSAGSICENETAASQLTTVTDARGNKTRYCYNKLSRVLEIWDARDNSTKLSYNSEANVESFIDAVGREFVFGYDQTNQDLISSQAPGQESPDTGEVAEVHYANDEGHDHGGDGHDHDNDGDETDEHKHLPIKTVDARGNHTNYAYDANHNLIEVHQTPKKEDIVFRYRYDDNGNLTRIEAPEPEPDPLDSDGNETQGNDTIFTYYPDDASVDGDDGMLETIDRPDVNGLGDMSFEYDGASRVLAMTDGKGQRTEVTYDAVDRLKTITYADLTTITYTYDDAGNVTERRERDGTVHAFSYDAKNQLDTHTRPDGSVIDYAYNKVGDLNRVTDRGGTTTYRYDVTNVLDKVTEPDGDAILLHPNAAYEYWRIDLPNNVSQRIKPWGSGKTRLIRAYDNKGTPDDNSDDAPAFFEQTYSYNDSTGADTGLVQEITDEVSGNETTFTYDSVGRLDQEHTLDSSGANKRRFTYDYDKNSNRILEETKKAQDDPVTTQFHYNHANQLTCSYDGSRAGCDTAGSPTTYSYDGNGSLTEIADPAKDDPKQLHYDAADHTTRVDNPDGTSAQMSYQDATQDQRDDKTVSDALGVVGAEVDYDHDLIGLAREERTEGLATETTSYTRTNKGRLLGQRKSSGDEYFILDHLGSVREVTDSSGDVVQSYNYEPYGRIFWQRSSGHGNSWRFAQGYFDTDISLYKLGVRYYGFNQGRFSQFDPMAGKIAQPVTLNAYQYAACDPANRVDPTGRVDCPALIDALGAFGVLNVVSAAYTALTSFSFLFLGKIAAAAGFATVAGLAAAAGTISGALVIVGTIVDLACE